MPLPKLHITKKKRRESKAVGHISSFAELTTECDDLAEVFLFVWRLARFSVSESQDASTVPGLTTLCAQLGQSKPASKVGYLPLIPQPPTDASVMKEAMIRIVKTAHALGDEWVLITGDQATYELARAVRDSDRNQFEKVVLLLGGFHQALNFMGAICKIFRGCGMEALIAEAGLCSEGTARKIFGDKADYYQTLHAIRILNEATWQLLWEMFQDSSDVDAIVTVQVSRVVSAITRNSASHSEVLLLIRESRSHITKLMNDLKAFLKTLARKPNSVFWGNFLDMSDILLRLLYCQWEGDWYGHLSESTAMLPYLTAAGHYKYGHESLPLYLCEMKGLAFTAPDVHAAMEQGLFVARRTSGAHNAISPDMLLEQTYNTDATEQSGLDKTAGDPAARTKWVLTKPLTAEVSAKLKDMIGLSHSSDDHHEAGASSIVWDVNYVQIVKASMQCNPFSLDSESLMNIMQPHRCIPTFSQLETWASLH